ncbi:MAG: SLC13 family permease [Fimbriimonadaceae bacterium]|nr:SLC13 family permease [Alphaproteobacteria bacterium]
MQQMWITFAVISVTVVFLANEKVRLEVVCVSVIVAFLLLFEFMPVVDQEGTNLLPPERLLAGLANPALITIIALLMVGQGMFHTGALDGAAQLLTRVPGRHTWLLLPAVLIFAALTSAFMNNTPVVVMLIPIVSAMANRLGQSPSITLMPLSFVCILGGMMTLIGSSTNLLVAGVATEAGLPPIGFFDFTIPGAFIAAIGILYVLFVMPRLLKPRATMAEEVTGHGGKQFIAQIDISYDHPLVGIKSVAGMFPELKEMTVRLVQRGEKVLLPPFEDITLSPGDEIIVAATRSALTDALKAREAILTVDLPGQENDSQPTRQGELVLAEAVVAPGSRMIGRTVDTSGLHAESGCIVLGIQRRSRMIRISLSDIRLEAGDVLLVMGSPKNVRTLRFSRDLLLMEWSASELPRTALALRALAIFAGVVIAASTGLVPIVVAALAGALAMVPAGCLNVRQAARAFDRKIYLLIGASLAMAAPLEVTGGADFLANSLVNGLDSAPNAVLLSALFALVAILTNFLSNNATAVLFAPIAIGVAAKIGADPMAFTVTVIFAANCSFATPVAYQTNLLVMGPGHYRFSDFLRAGCPLAILVWLSFSFFAPWYYNL